MFRNYLKIAIRNLYKSPVFSFINITGLIIGLVCSMFIGLWVADELSWDNFHGKKNRLYRVYLNGKGDDGIFTQMAICLPLWEEFKNNEPGIEHVTPTNWGWNVLLSTGEKKLEKFAYFASEDFLKMFSFQLVKGSPENQLKDPSTIVITESTARDLFGTEDPIGKVVRMGNTADLSVSGVVKDPPQNSTFIFSCLIPFSTYINTDPWVKRCMTNWNNNSFNLYVAFKEGADPLVIENRVKDVIKKHSTEETTFEVTFLPMERWRLYDEFENGKSVSGNIIYVRIFSIIGIFIIIIACINFTNLATARSQHRAKEVGIRKSIGSARKDLIIQFLGETLLLATVAFLLSIAVVEVILPQFNTLVNKDLEIDYSAPTSWLAALSIVVATGVTAGSYPAFYLSAFRPVAVLKGKISEGTRGSLPRKVMVTAQFFFSIVLIIATMITYLQLQFLKNRPVGYDQDKLLMVYAGDVSKHHRAIKKELIDQHLASAVTTASSPITDIYSYEDEISWPGKREDQRSFIADITIGYDYTKTTRTKIIEGRDFNEAFNDTASVILNQAAVDYMGLKNPIGETIRDEDEAYTVIGVSENIVMTSPYESADPTAFFFNERWASEMLIRLPDNSNTRDVLGGIEKIFKKYNPEFPFGYRFADQEYNKKFSAIELISKLTNLFASLAIFISCLGLFGLTAFMAERRTKEIGIRKVMGASVASIVSLLSKEFALLVLVAFLLAAPITLWQANAMLEQYTYRVDIPWWVLPFTGLTALTFAIVTVSTQAIRSAMANPVRSLRSE